MDIAFAIGTTIGTDCHGNPCRLGDTDSDGERVGWINPETGDAYQSLYEFLRATVEGRHHDALWAWRHGDPRDPKPTPHPIVAELCETYDCAELADALVTDCLDAALLGDWLRGLAGP